MIPNLKYCAPLRKDTVDEKIAKLNDELNEQTTLQKVISEGNRLIAKIAEAFFVIGSLTVLLGAALSSVVVISVGALFAMIGIGCWTIRDYQVRALKVECALRHLEQSKDEIDVKNYYEAMSHFVRSEVILSENQTDSLDVILNKLCRLIRREKKRGNVTDQLQELASKLISIAEENKKNFLEKKESSSDSRASYRYKICIEQMSKFKSFGEVIKNHLDEVIDRLGEPEKTTESILKLFAHINAT